MRRLRRSSLVDGLFKVCTCMSAIVQVFGRRHDEPSTRCGGRRPKSAKARSRGRLGTRGAKGGIGVCWRRPGLGGMCRRDAAAGGGGRKEEFKLLKCRSAKPPKGATTL